MPKGVSFFLVCFLCHPLAHSSEYSVTLRRHLVHFHRVQASHLDRRCHFDWVSSFYALNGGDISLHLRRSTSVLPSCQRLVTRANEEYYSVLWSSRLANSTPVSSPLRTSSGSAFTKLAKPSSIASGGCPWTRITAHRSIPLTPIYRMCVSSASFPPLSPYIIINVTRYK
jgi:hypothetical protein